MRGVRPSCYDSGVAELRVRRERDSAGFLRRILIELDGADWCGLRPGEEQTVAVPAGRHVLRARMDWITSKALVVEVDADEVIELETSMPWRAAVDMFFKPRSALTLGRL